MRKPFFIIILLLLMEDTFFYVESSDIRMLGILAVYIFMALKLKLKSSTTFFLALFLLLFAYLQFVFSNTQLLYTNPGPPVPTAERTAVWVFLFMVAGIIQKWKE